MALILILENNSQIRGMLRRILERAWCDRWQGIPSYHGGKAGLTARSWKGAIEICAENKERIDIVILGMIMPDMSAGMTYDRMKDINPNVKVLLSSGYGINGQAIEILDQGCNGFVQKPFLIAPFAEKLKEVLEGK